MRLTLAALIDRRWGRVALLALGWLLGFVLGLLILSSGAAFAQGETDPEGVLILQLTAGRFLVSVTPADEEQYADPVTVDIDPLNPPAPIVIQLKWRNYSFSGTAKSQAGVAASRIDIFDELGTKLGTCPVNQTTGAFSFLSRKAAYVLKPVWADGVTNADARRVEASFKTGNPEPAVFVGLPTSASVTIRLVGPDALPATGTVTVERVGE